MELSLRSKWAPKQTATRIFVLTYSVNRLSMSCYFYKESFLRFGLICISIASFIH